MIQGKSKISKPRQFRTTDVGIEIAGPLYTVGTALGVLDYLSQSSEGLGVREVGRALNVRKSTVHRILQTLSSAGFLRQDLASERYLLGPKILEIGARFQRSMSFRKLAHRYLEELQAASGETVFLSVLDGLEAVVVDRIDSAQPLRMVSEIGSREPAYCTAIGKILLASIPQPALIELLSDRPNLKKYTGKTISSPEVLAEELRRVRKAGYAVDDEEYLGGVRCVAGPIWDSHARTVAALSVSGPSFRVTRKRLSALAEQVRSATLKISCELGYQAGTTALRSVTKA